MLPPDLTAAPIWHRLWGKARPVDGSAAAWHPLWKHALDVAAVGDALLEARPAFLHRLAAALGQEADTARVWLRYLLALHDLGKVTRGFQAKVPALWAEELLGRLPETGILDPGHPAAGAGLLEWFFAADACPGWHRDGYKAIFGAVFGHHGRPVAWTLNKGAFRGEDKQLAQAYIATMRAQFLPPDVPEPPETAIASLLLAGFAVLADWLGSNQTYFPYDPAAASVADYWAGKALPQARRAVADARLIPTPPAPPIGFATLTGGRFTPSEVQRWAETVAIPSGPSLTIIEDITGAGKTEAAVILAQRLLAAGRARGIYLGLPTQATANALHQRLKGLAGVLFEGPEPPNVSLIHGNSWLARKTSADDGDSAAESAAWLGQSNRHRLLSDLGVGTLDQALLAVLPVKHQALRLHALADRILIVDEAHAYDAYTFAALERLTAFQALLGGSMIVLSATLTDPQKQRLARAWGTPLPKRLPPEYPLITHLAGGVAEIPCAPRPDRVRRLPLRRLASVAAVCAEIRAAQARGAAVAWVRNTVDDVLAAQAALAAEGVAAQIFHARFAQGDRHAVETDIVARFGPDAPPDARRGRVLVATQVIEQSLDVDFDLLISDLAPVDLLIQRAGRLWRHLRPPEARPLPQPALLILSPDPAQVASASWGRDLLPGGFHVYSNPLVLWRTAAALFTAGRLDTPQDVRPLINRVYAPDDLPDDPPALLDPAARAQAEDWADRAFANGNLLDPLAGYSQDGQPWMQEADVSTRLTQETSRVRLALWQNGALLPWADAASPAEAWALSELRVSRRRLAGAPPPPDVPADAVAALRASWGRYDADACLPLILTPEAEGRFTGTITDKRGRGGTVQYARLTGLHLPQT